jgi:hypothetical protein
VSRALVVSLVEELVVTSAGEHATQVDHLLDVDVLVSGTLEELDFGPHTHFEPAVAVLLHRSDHVEEGGDVGPLDVVTRRVLEDPPQCLAVMTIQTDGSG